MDFGFSDRETDVLCFAAQGMTDKEIALRGDVALSTIRTYWERIRRKTGTLSRTHAVAVAVQRGGISVGPASFTGTQGTA